MKGFKSCPIAPENPAAISTFTQSIKSLSMAAKIRKKEKGETLLWMTSVTSWSPTLRAQDARRFGFFGGLKELNFGLDIEKQRALAL